MIIASNAADVQCILAVRKPRYRTYIKSRQKHEWYTKLCGGLGTVGKNNNLAKYLQATMPPWAKHSIAISRPPMRLLRGNMLSNI